MADSFGMPLELAFSGSTSGTKPSQITQGCVALRHAVLCCVMLCHALLQDSDDEVLVPLEDVLMPHPEDFLDAQALGLTSQVCCSCLAPAVWLHGSLVMSLVTTVQTSPCPKQRLAVRLA
jgi:hypothetical protein